MKRGRSRYRLLVGLTVLALGSTHCSDSGADGAPPTASGAGAGGASGGAAPAAGSGGTPSDAGTGAGGAPSGGAAGAPSGGGASAGMAGSGGGEFVLPAGPYAPLLDLDADARLDEIPPERLVEACLIYNEYFKREIAQDDQLRAACVVDAVFVQGAGTVSDCETASQACIDDLGVLPPNACIAPEDGFVCTATLAEYVLCANELADQKRAEVELLRCESLDVPDIQSQLDAAAALPDSCVSFAADCPGFFPIAGAPDGGAP